MIHLLRGVVAWVEGAPLAYRVLALLVSGSLLVILVLWELGASPRRPRVPRVDVIEGEIIETGER